jgi:hypothetical protein
MGADAKGRHMYVGADAIGR